ncbi:MAG TPA: dihydrofolate reductase [Candidatus Paceibacterota bacterium]|jgi:dihydrofolate reductase|nr:dihydrofolate reductase [Candidatus Paceibacterota bacterium]
MNISLIGAMGKNREFGLGDQLPWHLPDDLKHFKALTRGHTVIMGRKTYESIGKPLPDRKNIIITRNKDFKADGCVVVGSMEEALAETKNDPAGNDRKVFVIGGAEIYKLALPYAQKIYLTLVDASPKADKYFPEFGEKEWRLIKEESHARDEKHPHAFVFREYERA